MQKLSSFIIFQARNVQNYIDSATLQMVFFAHSPQKVRQGDESHQYVWWNFTGCLLFVDIIDFPNPLSEREAGEILTLSHCVHNLQSWMLERKLLFVRAFRGWGAVSVGTMCLLRRRQELSQPSNKRMCCDNHWPAHLFEIYNYLPRISNKD